MAHDPVEASNQQIKNLHSRSKQHLETMGKEGKSKAEIQAYRDRVAAQLKALRLINRAIKSSQKHLKSGGKPMQFHKHK